MRKRSTGLLPFSAESGGERVICPDRAGLEKIEIGDPKGGKNGWIRCTARGMLIAGTFKGTSQIRETQAVQGVRALLKEVPLSPPLISKGPWTQGLFCFYGLRYPPAYPFTCKDRFCTICCRTRPCASDCIQSARRPMRIERGKRPALISPQIKVVSIPVIWLT